MTLRESRCTFTEQLALLILFAISQGYEVAIDEATERITSKDPTSDHRRSSLHHEGLAADLILYRDGSWLKDTAEYLRVGEWWEQRGAELGIPLRWGGRFNDGNHFSFEWQGRK